MKKKFFMTLIACALGSVCMFGAGACSYNGENESKKASVTVTEEEWKEVCIKSEIGTNYEYKELPVYSCNFNCSVSNESGVGYGCKSMKRTGKFYSLGKALYVTYETEYFETADFGKSQIVETLSSYIAAENGVSYSTGIYAVTPDDFGENKAEWTVYEREEFDELTSEEYRLSDGQIINRYFFDFKNTYIGITPSYFADVYSKFVYSGGKYVFIEDRKDVYGSTIFMKTANVKINQAKHVSYFSYDVDEEDFEYGKHTSSVEMKYYDYNNTSADEVVPAEALKAVTDYKTAKA